MPYPSTQTDQAVLSVGRVSCKEAKAEKDRFLALAMPDTFVKDLQKLVEAFATSILDHDAGKSDQASAQAGITSALAKGLDAVQTLHTIVANQLVDSPEVMSAWERARKVDRSRRSRKTGDQSASPDAPVTAAQVAVAMPASTPAPAPAPAPAPTLAATPAAPVPPAPERSQTRTDTNAIAQPSEAGVLPVSDREKAAQRPREGGSRRPRHPRL